VIVAALREYAAAVAVPTKHGYDAWQGALRGVVPASSTILKRHGGSWNAALAAAEIEPAASQRRGRRRGSGRWSHDDVARIVADCGRDLGHLPTANEYEGWRRSRDDVPSGIRIRQMWGTWMRAVEAAALLAADDAAADVRELPDGSGASGPSG
jgi:hypothetical protein